MFDHFRKQPKPPGETNTRGLSANFDGQGLPGDQPVVPVPLPARRLAPLAEPMDESEVKPEKKKKRRKKKKKVDEGEIDGGDQDGDTHRNDEIWVN